MTSVLGYFASLLIATAPAPRDTVAPTPQPPATASVTELRPLEVRIRKLFLVRPDLTRFPIPYDTVC